MITRIELNGFKTFQNFSLELSPFQVVVGPNGAGKSNLFDALRLLTRLVDTDLRSAFQELRGNAVELFTTFPDGHSVQLKRNRGKASSIPFIFIKTVMEAENLLWQKK